MMRLCSGLCCGERFAGDAPNSACDIFVANVHRFQFEFEPALEHDPQTKENKERERKRNMI